MHVSLSNQRNIYIAQHARASSDAERIFYENVVLFIDSLIKQTGVDTLDFIPDDKRFLSGLKYDDIIQKLSDISPVENFSDWYTAKPTANLVIIRYNGEFDVQDDKVIKDVSAIVPDGTTNAFGASLKAWLSILPGYSLVACDVLGQHAFFIRDECVPSDLHGVGDLRLLYRSLHATMRPDEYYEPTPNKIWWASTEALATREDSLGAM